MTTQKQKKKLKNFKKTTKERSMSEKSKWQTVKEVKTNGGGRIKWDDFLSSGCRAVQQELDIVSLCLLFFK